MPADGVCDNTCDSHECWLFPHLFYCKMSSLLSVVSDTIMAFSNSTDGNTDGSTAGRKCKFIPRISVCLRTNPHCCLCVINPPANILLAFWWMVLANGRAQQWSVFLTGLTHSCPLTSQMSHHVSLMTQTWWKDRSNALCSWLHSSWLW